MQNTNLAGPLGGFLSTGDERLAGWPLLVCVRASLWFGGVAGTRRKYLEAGGGLRSRHPDWQVGAWPRRLGAAPPR